MLLPEVLFFNYKSKANVSKSRPGQKNPNLYGFQRTDCVKPVGCSDSARVGSRRVIFMFIFMFIFLFILIITFFFHVHFNFNSNFRF